ncbi:MAG: pyrroline-5-carboxylate reductase [Gammaproteobacteria bacterium]|nr:pyrroline-5-carboxylate reductase [Gammaproteobacteria bacterium]
MNERIAFVGGGNMAHALATRLAGVGTFDLVVSEPLAEQRARFEPPITTTVDNVTAVRDAAAVVLAVKPQVLETVVREIGGVVREGQLVVSIAAGVPLASVERWLGNRRSVVRCMPNTPALVGAGISGLVANAAVSPRQRRLAEAVLGAGGEVVWFDSDTDLDVVTALSGSGPAYFFAVIEALEAAGARLGLAPETARRLVVATADGAAKMARDDDPAELRKRVTSPGGTTERALSILAERSLPELLDAAVEGAFQRSRELAREFAGEPGQPPDGQQQGA